MLFGVIDIPIYEISKTRNEQINDGQYLLINITFKISLFSLSSVIERL